MSKVGFMVNVQGEKFPDSHSACYRAGQCAAGSRAPAALSATSTGFRRTLVTEPAISRCAEGKTVQWLPVVSGLSSVR